MSDYATAITNVLRYCYLLSGKRDEIPVGSTCQKIDACFDWNTVIPRYIALHLLWLCRIFYSES